MKRSRKKKKIRRNLLAALCVLFFALALFSAWKIWSIASGYRTAERRYGDLAGAVVAAAPAEGSVPSPRLEDTAVPEQSDPSVEEGAAEQEQLEQTRESSPVSVDFEALRAISGDVVGWIYLPQTAINYPVVQGRNNSFYLDRFIDGQSNMGGSLFADYACPSDFSGKNTIIYGHNMKDGSMFALIDDYADQSFYEQHPVLYLNTPSANYRVDVFSGFTSDPEGFIYTTSFASDEDYAAFLRAAVSASEIACPVEAGVGDRIVTLSTCTYTDADVRFVLCGKLTEIG